MNRYQAVGSPLLTRAMAGQVGVIFAYVCPPSMPLFVSMCPFYVSSCLNVRVSVTSAYSLLPSVTPTNPLLHMNNINIHINVCTYI